MGSNGLPDPSATPDTPCEAKDTPQRPLKDDLKKKLDFTCPAGADCILFTKNNNASRHQYHCLSIQKEVSGKKLQVLSRVSYKTGEYQIWCHDDRTSYLVLGPTTCKASKGWGGGLHNLENTEGFKQDNDCWK